MTIAAGFRCADGIILCADRQVSVPGAFKYFEKKISVERYPWWSLGFTFAGEPGFAREVQEKIVREAGSLEGNKERLREIVDNVLLSTARLYTQGDTPLQLLVALGAAFSDLELLKFDGRALHTADDFNCLGVGNSPLIRFLSDRLYSPRMPLEDGKSLAAYLVRKAEQYIEWCGGSIDVAAIHEADYLWEWLPEAEVNERIENMERQEKRLTDLFLRQPSSPSEP